MRFETLRQRLRSSKAHARLVGTYAGEAYRFFRKQLEHNASSRTRSNKAKLEFTLLRDNHVIEKGMSMRNPRRGFGIPRVANLLERLDAYFVEHGDSRFLAYPLHTIGEYIKLTRSNGIEIPGIENAHRDLCERAGLQGFPGQVNAGTKPTTRKELLEKSAIDFEAFVKSRHSIRYFSPIPPDKETVDKALEIAQFTPSACNRQGWRAFVFEGERNQCLLKWQGGANGFETEIKKSILVTADLNAFLHYEPYQAYVDGGLYAMSLIYALHSVGLGSIPLSTGFESPKIERLHKEFGIPDNLVPIVIVGIGNLADEFNIAVSTRKPITATTTYVH